MKRDIPPEWLEVMEPKRLHSLRDLATASGVSVQTITRLVFGEGTSAETVAAVADTLKLTPEKIWELHGKPRTNPFTLEPDADRLSPTERAAVRAVVKALATSRPATLIEAVEADETLPELTKREVLRLLRRSQESQAQQGDTGYSKKAARDDPDDPNGQQLL